MKLVKQTTKYIALLAVPALLYTSCKVEPIPDPNNPSAGSVSANASLSEIQNLVTGTESAMRDAMNFYYDDVSVIGREYYRFSTSDPRFTSDLLGKESAVLDNNTFYITNPFAARYRVVKNANILIGALTGTKASISDAQRKAGIAYAKTIQAYQFLLIYNLLYNNGVRFDVSDPDKLGPFLNRQQSIDAIANLLNEANADLKGNNISFPFTTTVYSSNAAEFSKFNRALAARVAIYRQDWAGANTALAESFLDLTGNLNNGAFLLFSANGGDQLNPMFFPPNSSGETRVVQPSFITDAAPGDTRVTAKTQKRTATGFQDGLSSDYDFLLYKTNTDPIPIIRNEELILIYAEVKAQTGVPSESVKAINVVRTAASLPVYGGATDTNSLITEILKQRRYSLFGEGHRWIDLRRYNLLAQLPIDRPGDDVWQQFPVPANE
ncbi:MAG TPA: RagB/SusD family nutrient uptake outer membrane protein [Flavisolibacter sp.]|nr:RagB/SusD family nutrient uptake outer membrane protein [Flavisolibacter sp.]